MRESFVWILGLTALCFTAMVGADPEPAVPAADVIRARWDARDVLFVYGGTITRYSCPALEEKVRNVLIAIGAHPQTRVRAVGCQGARPSRVIRLEIATAVPRPAAEPKASRVIEREKLLARFGIRQEILQGEFSARPQRVRLNKSSLGFRAGDCELLTQLRDQVFPRLGVRAERDNLNCSPHQLSSAAPRLNLVALVPSEDPPIAEGGAVPE